MHVFVVFIDLERHMPFAYLPERMGSKSSSSLSKIIFVCGINFKVFWKKEVFKKRWEASRHENGKDMRLFNFS